MQAVVPIYLKDSEAFWHSKECIQHIRTLLLSLRRAKKIDDILVVTDQIGMAEELKDIVRVEISQKADGHDETLPSGGTMVCDTLSKELDRTTPLVMVNFRNPLLSAENLDLGIREYHDTGCEMLMSAYLMKDHPCQLKQFLQFMDIGLIHMLDTASCKEKHIRTHPFDMDWSLKKTTGKPDDEFFTLSCMDNHTPIYTPVTKSEMDNITHNVVWRKESDSSARLYIAPRMMPDRKSPETEKKLVGLAIKGDFEELSFLLYSTDTDNGWHIETMNKNTGENATKSKEEDLLRLLPLRAGAKSFDVPLTQGNFTSHLVADCNAIFFSHFRSFLSGGYDVVEHFSADNELWHYDVAQAGMVNKANGKWIHGRQCFTPVYYPDGAFAVAIPENLKKGCSSLKNAHLHIMDQDENPTIRRKADVALLRIRLAMTEQIREQS